jgi:hypothetical protein
MAGVRVYIVLRALYLKCGLRFTLNGKWSSFQPKLGQSVGPTYIYFTKLFCWWVDAKGFCSVLHELNDNRDI